MTSGFVLALVLQTLMAAPLGDSYKVAYQSHAEQGKPLLVLVGADWCPGCRQMKERIIPEAKKKGLLDKVAFAVVNADHDRALAQKLMHGGSIPQLVLFRQTPDGSLRQQLTGAQSLDSVRKLVTIETSDPMIQLTGSSE